MAEWADYLLRSAYVFAVFFGFYLLMLRRNTFFTLQRIYLLAVPVFSLILPLIQISPSMGKEIVPQLHYITCTIGGTFDQSGHLNRPFGFSHEKWLIIIYLIPTIFLICMFLIRLLRLCRISDNTMHDKTRWIKLYLSSVISSPFSFFNRVYCKPEDIGKSYFRIILLHELGHIRQGHSLDILFTEVYCAIQWFNPLVWLYRRSLRAVHEYLADTSVLKAGIDPLTYQEEIVLQSLRTFRKSVIAQEFTGRYLRRRLTMISTAASPSIKRLNFLIMVPLCLYFLFLFRNTQAQDPIAEFNLPLTKGSVSSLFGKRIHPLTGKTVFHNGIDIAAKSGTPVLASAAGLVTETGLHEKAGKYIIIAHTDSFATFYSQLSEILVTPNDTVNTGAIIGRVGNSGLSTGPHLHFEIRKGSVIINPQEKIDFSSLVE